MSPYAIELLTPGCAFSRSRACARAPSLFSASPALVSWTAARSRKCFTTSAELTWNLNPSIISLSYWQMALACVPTR